MPPAEGEAAAKGSGGGRRSGGAAVGGELLTEAYESDGPPLKAREWHAIAIVVDAHAGSVRTFVDGALSVASQSTRIVRDGAFSLKVGRALT